MKKAVALFLTIAMILSVTGCGSSVGKTAETSKSGESGEAEEVTLTIAGPWAECVAIEKAAADFSREYPECKVVYEFLQDFEDTLPIRLKESEDIVDLCLVNNIQNGSELMPYMQELSELGDDLILTDTFEGLVENFHLQSTDEAEKEKIYAVPIGAEIRGMFVNKTLLDSLGLEVPKNRKELLDDCAVLNEKGYIALQGNPGFFAQQLLYPYICNLVVNGEDYDSVYAKVNNRDRDAMMALFSDPMEFLYGLVENNYYNYKYCETELGLFTDSSNEGYARSFLNVKETETDYEKLDDIGQIAFMPTTKSLQSVLDKTKEDYHSEIEYEFILSPVSEEGGYAYLSPGRGISINKGSKHIDWCTKFLNYIFEKENNKTLADAMGVVPNTKDAMDELEKSFEVSKTQISQLGQMTFQYDFFSVINDTLIEISKSNNPKYMMTNDDGSVSMYSLDYYLDRFGQRISGELKEE